MIDDPIDPSPFLGAMPEAVRASIEQARTVKGPISVWLVAKGRGWGQVGTTITLLRDKKQPVELVGWLAGRDDRMGHKLDVGLPRIDASRLQSSTPDRSTRCGPADRLAGLDGHGAVGLEGRRAGSRVGGRGDLALSPRSPRRAASLALRLRTGRGLAR